MKGVFYYDYETTDLRDMVRFGKIQYIVVEKTSVLKKKDGILWNKKRCFGR